MPSPIVASIADLPPDVVAVLDAPPEPVDLEVEADGIPFVARTWGRPADPPLVLVHGITASSRTFWRIAPALGVALGRYVVAPDQAGHGRTGNWAGRVAIRDNAGSIAAFLRAAGLDRPDLRIVGHSWGGMTVAALPIAGIRPEVLVLFDPPALPIGAIASMLDDPIERHYDDLEEALHAIGRLHPTWPWGDVVAKAEPLTQFDEPAVRAILTENGDWDGGLEAIRDPAAAGVAIRLVRGEVASGGLMPDPAAEAIGAVIGAEHVLTIAGGGHSPMRNRLEATVVALLRALEPG
ncbi:MAG TPA: alpha/beta hydrolase [Candidatus Limnocylindrales bacterium]|jgi:pimeloyl-ACP methyl ester carboxylesterase